MIEDAENSRLAAWVDTQPAVILNIRRQPGANVIVVAEQVKKLLPQLQNSLPGSIDVAVLSDRTTVTANLGAGYDFLSKQSSLTSAFAGAPSAAFTTKGIEPSKWLGRGGLGLVNKVSDTFELSARYDIEFREGFTNQTGSVKARWAF